MKISEEAFLLAVKNHEMTVLLDQGVYRHLRFAQPNTNYQYFDLITGPGYLLYRGDMGTYEFERLPDMFKFFRSAPHDLIINPGYWGEKLRSICKYNGYRAFDNSKFQFWVQQRVEEWKLEHGVCEGTKWWDEFHEEIETLFEQVYDSHSALAALSDYSFEHSYFMAEDIFGTDIWELDFTDYTNNYLWCCYAIVWGIQQYDAENFKI